MHLRALIAFLLLIWSPAAFAQTAPWRVTEAAGQVQVQRGSQVIAARRGAAIAPGEVVSTGANGRAVLVRGRDFVIVSPRTRLRVPGTSEQGGNIRMIQAAGRAQYRIERQAAPHFAVRTPHLVALVKGTVFTVTVGENGATVAVSEGRVEVATLAGEMRQMVEPGFAASVSAADPARLSHGRSDDAQAAHEPRRSPTGGAASAEREARGTEDGDRVSRGGGHGQPRLEYGDLGNISRGNGGGTGHELNRIRDAERSVAEAVAQAVQGANHGGPGPANGPGAGGGSGSGGGSLPAPGPATDPAAPSTPAPPSTSPPSGSDSSGSGGSNSGPGSTDSGSGSSNSGPGSSGSGSGSSGSGSSGTSGPSGPVSAPLDPTISLPTAPATTVVVAVPSVDASEIVPLPGEPSAPPPGEAPPSSTLDPTISLPTAPATTVVVEVPSLDPSAIVPLPGEPAPAPSEPAAPPPPPATESVPPPTVTAPTEPSAPPPPPPSAPTNTQNRCLLGLICL